MKTKIQWNDAQSIDLIRWYNAWPDSIEERKRLLLECYKIIDYYADTEENKIHNKKLLKKASNTD